MRARSSQNKKTITVALGGNPNSGKSTVFNQLTGARQHIANYPGVTVEKKEGVFYWGDYEVRVVDLPGTYSLTADTPDERVARRFLTDEKPDILVDILDGSNLERNLYLAVQFSELGIPVVLDLNMADEMERRGIKIDLTKFSKLMRCPVVPTVGTKSKGVRELREAIYALAEGNLPFSPVQIDYGADCEKIIRSVANYLADVKALADRYNPRYLAVKLLEDDCEAKETVVSSVGADAPIFAEIEKLCRHIEVTTGKPLELFIANKRYGFVSAVYSQCVTSPGERRMTASDRADRVMTARLLGPIILLAALYLIYEFTFRASQFPVAWLQSLFAALADTLRNLLPEGLMRAFVVEGVLGGVGAVLGLVPVIMLLFFFLAIVEDSGYMARIAFIADRLLRRFGLHGKSAVALVVGGGIGGGCAVAGVMAARTLRDPKERLATILVTPFMNCGAKLSVYALIISAFFSANRALLLLLVTVFSWAVALLAALVLRKTVLASPETPFVMELPPYRMPTLKGLAIHMLERTYIYLKKAGTIILAGSVIVWAALSFPYPHQKETGQSDVGSSVAGVIGQKLQSVSSLAGFDWKMNIALLAGFGGKELVVSTFGTIYSVDEGHDRSAEPLAVRLRQQKGWNPLIAFSFLLFMVLYVPCIAAVAVIKTETNSWKWPVFSVIYSTLLAFAVASVVYQIGRFAGLG